MWLGPEGPKAPTLGHYINACTTNSLFSQNKQKKRWYFKWKGKDSIKIIGKIILSNIQTNVKTFPRFQHIPSTRCLNSNKNPYNDILWWNTHVSQPYKNIMINDWDPPVWLVLYLEVVHKYLWGVHAAYVSIFDTYMPKQVQLI